MKEMHAPTMRSKRIIVVTTADQRGEGATSAAIAARANGTSGPQRRNIMVGSGTLLTTVKNSHPKKETLTT